MAKTKNTKIKKTKTVTDISNSDAFITAALVDPATVFVANHSGGKDSQAQFIKMLERIPANRILVVHASLGAAEWDGALELAEEQARAAGCAFRVARASKTLFEMVERRFESRPEVPSWPSSSTRQCTSDLKRDPIAKVVRAFVKEQGFTRVVNCLGLRAEESPGRAKRPLLSRVERNCTFKLEWIEWLPIQDMSTFEVLPPSGRLDQVRTEISCIA